MKPIVVTVALATVFFAGSAFADVATTATADLNVRAGPGTEFEVVGVVGNRESVSIQGCLEGSKWCALSGSNGWVYSDYLAAEVAGSTVVITERPAELEVPTVAYEGPPAAIPGAVGGAIAGAVIAGPVGAVVGEVAGAAIGAAVDPPAEVRTYVTSNPIDPVYLEGEVVVGATLPEGVRFAQVPDYQYAYVYVNGVPVLVEPSTRQVVYIIR